MAPELERRARHADSFHVKGSPKHAKTMAGTASAVYNQVVPGFGSGVEVVSCHDPPNRRNLTNIGSDGSARKR